MENLHYDYQKIDSLNCYLNFILADRDSGKTYGLLKKMIKRHIRYKKEYLYLRRTKEEIRQCRDNLLNWIIANDEFPDYEFRCPGSSWQIKHVKEKNWTTFLHMKRLSSASATKGYSAPKLEYILFDEFTLEKTTYQRYLDNEIDLLFSLIETIMRDNEKIKIYCCGNATSINNPYTLFYGLYSLEKGFNFPPNRDKQVVFDYQPNMKKSQERKKKKFFNVIKGSRYAKMAYDSEFVYESQDFICDEPNNSYFQFCIVHDNITLGVHSTDDNIIYISTRYNKTCKNYFVIDKRMHTEDRLFLDRKSNTARILVNSYKNNMLYYSNQTVKTIFLDFLNKIGVY